MDDEKDTLQVGASDGKSRKVEVIFKDDESEVVLLRKKYAVAETIAEIRKRDPSKNGRILAELKSKEFNERTRVNLSGDTQEGIKLITFESETRFSAEPEAIDELERSLYCALPEKIDQYSGPFMVLLQSEELAVNDLGMCGKYVNALATVDFLVQGGCCHIIAERNIESSQDLDCITIEELCSDTRTFADLVTRILEETFALILKRKGE